MSEKPESVETVEVPKQELREVRILLGHPLRRLKEDADCNDNPENRARSRKGVEQLKEARSKLGEIRSTEEN